jgi:ribonuclease HII
VGETAKLTLGVDEAGRGAQIGPLVLAAVALTPEQCDLLLAAGLRDSKPLAARRRRALAATIRASASWAATEASSSRVVDRYVAGGFRGAPTLNVLEQRMATRLIRLAPPCTTIVADGQVLFRPLEDYFPNLRPVNHADDTEPSMVAAAILAKVERHPSARNHRQDLSLSLRLHYAKGLSRPRDHRLARSVPSLLRNPPARRT